MSGSETDKLFLAAHAKRTAGDLTEAKRLLGEAARLEPKNANIQTALAEVLLAEGRPSLAIEAAGRAVTLDPNLPPALIALGFAAGQLGNVGAALRHLRRAGELAPGSVGAATALLRILTSLERTAEAEALLDAAKADMAGDASSLNNLGTVALDLGHLEAASDLFAAASAADPEDPGILINLARAAGRATDDAGADRAIAQAFKLAPDDRRVRRTAGIILVNRGDPSAALPHLEAALAAAPDDADARLARGLTRLSLGDFVGGWADYEARLDASRGPGRRRFAVPRWAPAMGSGCRVLLHAEQGFGDTIQFVRHAAQVRATGAETIIQVQAPLVKIIRTAPGVDRVIGPGDPLPPIDAEAPLPSLPGILLAAGIGDKSVSVPYLSAPDEPPPPLPEGAGPLVGLAWRGNPNFTNDRRRSPGLRPLLPILGIPGIRFVGLQKDAMAELAEADPAKRVFDLAPQLADFSATARALRSLDLMITSDTAMAHLSGALGRPTWLLLSTAPDFRWGLIGDNTDHYPTTRIFRQAAAGDWSGPVAQVAAELEKFKA